MPRFLRFSGQMGRLAYFGYSCAVGFGLTFIVMLVVMVAAAAAGGRPFSLAGIPLPMLALGVSAGLIGLWAMVALMAQRLRDMGLPTLPILGLCLAFGFFDHFALARLFANMGWQLTDGASPVGAAVNLVVTLGLLFSPGGAFDSGDSGPAEPATVQAPVGRPAAATLVDRRQPRAQFGLRGR